MDIKTCVVCGEAKSLAMFRRNGIGSRQCKACCVKQAGAWKARHHEQVTAYRRRYYSERSTDAFETRRCEGCGHEFRYQKVKANYEDSAGRFCSKKCRIKRVAVACACCRRQFFVWPCMVGKRKYCGQVCAGTKRTPESITAEWLRRQHYCSTEWRAISASIMARDGHVCQKCPSTADLVVHHKVSWIISRDDSPQNLITLCRTCHANEHRDGDGRLTRLLPVAV